MKSHLKHRNLKKFVSNASNLRHYLLPTLTTRANLINLFFFFFRAQNLEANFYISWPKLPKVVSNGWKVVLWIERGSINWNFKTPVCVYPLGHCPYCLQPKKKKVTFIFHRINIKGFIGSEAEAVFLETQRRFSFFFLRFSAPIKSKLRFRNLIATHFLELWEESWVGLVSLGRCFFQLFCFSPPLMVGIAIASSFITVSSTYFSLPWIFFSGWCCLFSDSLSYTFSFQF